MGGRGGVAQSYARKAATTPTLVQRCTHAWPVAWPRARGRTCACFACRSAAAASFSFSFAACAALALPMGSGLLFRSLPPFLRRFFVARPEENPRCRSGGMVSRRHDMPAVLLT